MKNCITQVVSLDSDYWQVLIECKLLYCLYNKTVPIIINNRLIFLCMYVQRGSTDSGKSFNMNLYQISSKFSISSLFT